MKKSELLKRIQHLENSPVICIKLLFEFLKTEKIQQLGEDDHVFFNAYLNFIQTTHPTINPATFFTDPFLKAGNKKELEFLNKFLSKEVKKDPTMPCYGLEFILRTIHTINEPASALAITPEGNIVCGTCYETPSSYAEGSIVLLDSTGSYLKTLANEPASALAITPKGYIVSGTCHENSGSWAVGSIVLRDSTGKRIRTLANEPASALAFTPKGFLVSGTCHETDNFYARGRIVLRDSTGNYIRTLSNEPASALAITPEGYIVSGTCRKTDNVWSAGSVVLRDAAANRIAILENEPASALAITSKGYIVIGTCYKNNASYCAGKIIFKKPVLKKAPVAPSTLFGKINALLIDNATLACAQFHKGWWKKDPSSYVPLLPPEILVQIYIYVFPFPDMKTPAILNPDCFPRPTQKDVIQVSSAALFARRIFKISFFEPSGKDDKKPKAQANPEAGRCWLM